MSLFWRALIMTFEWKDFFRDAYTGTVDTETGYAVVSSQEPPTAETNAPYLRY